MRVECASGLCVCVVVQGEERGGSEGPVMVVVLIVSVTSHVACREGGMCTLSVESRHRTVGVLGVEKSDGCAVPLGWAWKRRRVPVGRD